MRIAHLLLIIRHLGVIFVLMVGGWFIVHHRLEKYRLIANVLDGPAAS